MMIAAVVVMRRILLSREIAKAGLMKLKEGLREGWAEALGREGGAEDCGLTAYGYRIPLVNGAFHGRHVRHLE